VWPRLKGEKCVGSPEPFAFLEPSGELVLASFYSEFSVSRVAAGA